MGQRPNAYDAPMDRTFLFGGGVSVTVKELAHEDGGIGGGSTFDSGIALGSWILRHKQAVKGLEVLELGSGTGLVAFLSLSPHNFLRHSSCRSIPSPTLLLALSPSMSLSLSPPLLTLTYPPCFPAGTAPCLLSTMHPQCPRWISCPGSACCRRSRGLTTRSRAPLRSDACVPWREPRRLCSQTSTPAP